LTVCSSTVECISCSDIVSGNLLVGGFEVGDIKSPADCAIEAHPKVPNPPSNIERRVEPEIVTESFPYSLK
jgi:hypothetical protein